MAAARAAASLPLGLTLAATLVGLLAESAAGLGLRASEAWNPLASINLGAKTSSTASCRMTGDGFCAISSMPKDESTLVYPGGPTRCIYSKERHVGKNGNLVSYEASDFAFQVVPGDSDKLLLLFQDGGAAWNQLTTEVTTRAQRTAWDIPLEGILERGGPGAGGNPNGGPFRHHTVVVVLYCSGDMHIGNVTRSYLDTAGRPVEQRGLLNSEATIAWAKANMDRKLQSLLLVGASAGALGLQLLTGQLLRLFDYERAGVLADSFAGIFPDGFEGPITKELTNCVPHLYPAHFLEKCNAGTLKVTEVWDHWMETFPQVAFGSLNSKHDLEQIAYYSLASLTSRIDHRRPRPLSLSLAEQERHHFSARSAPEGPNSNSSNVTGHFSRALMSLDVEGGDASSWPFEASSDSGSGSLKLTQEEYFRKLNVILRGYNRHSNYVSYLVAGSRHVHTIPHSHNVVGQLESMGVPALPAPLHSWLSRFGSASRTGIPPTLKSICDGKLVREPSLWKGTNYCDADQAGKTLLLRSRST